MKNIKRGSKLPSTPESQFEGHLSFSSSPGLFVFSTELRFLPGFKGITRLERGCDSTTHGRDTKIYQKSNTFFTWTQNRYIIFTFYLTITRASIYYHHHNHHHHHHRRHHHLLSDLNLLDLLIINLSSLLRAKDTTTELLCIHLIRYQWPIVILRQYYREYYRRMERLRCITPRVKKVKN